MIKNNISTTIDLLQYKEFISEDERLKIRFDTDTGQLTDLSSRKKIYFDYEFSSGMIVCSYENVEQSNVDEKNEIYFIFVDEQILYSSTYHLIFINFDDLI